MRRGARSLLAVVFALSGAACEEDGAATFVRTAPGDGYFDWTWPDDRRLDEGWLATSEFPNPTRGGLFGVLLERGERLVRGFGLAAPLYVPFTGAFDPASLPADAAASTRADASVFLCAIDETSPVFGARVPIEWQVFEEPTPFLPGHVLAVRPAPGFPLEPATKYALVVTRSVRDAKGLNVGAEPAFAEALRGAASADADDRAHFGALRPVLRELGLEASDVAGAAIFTTQVLVDDLLKLRDWALAQPAPVVRNLKLQRSPAEYLLVEGEYDAPYLIHGNPPYETEGGEMRFDAAGAPQVAYVEPMRLTICLPRTPVPPEGFPVVFSSHGTGGDYTSVTGECAAYASDGLAAFGIDQPLHGPRARGATSCFGLPAGECFFNFVNPVSARNLIRHSAIDHLFLRRAIETISWPAGIDPEHRAIRFDLRHPAFFGHSQGGLTGSLYAAIEPGLSAAVLSGAGGHITTSLLLRDHGQLKDLIEGPLYLDTKGRDTLDAYHPALALAQALGEVADPLNYARHWIRAPLGRRKSMFVTSGLEDVQTPAATAEALALAGGVPQLSVGATNAPLFALAGLDPVDAPVQGNIPGLPGQPPTTAIFRQFPGRDHFVVFDDESVQAQIRSFLRGAVAGTPPQVPAP